MKETSNITGSRRKKKNAVSGGTLGENVHFQKTLKKTVDDGVNDIIEQAKRYKKNPISSRTGYVAEADHCTTFNTKNALKRSEVRAVREKNGNHGDYRIQGDNTMIKRGEVKYHGSAKTTENAMRGYDNQQLVGPSDQIKDVKEIARRKAIKGKSSPKPSRQKVGSEHEAVNKNVTGSISDGKTKSTPRSLKDAKKLTRKATKGKISKSDAMPTIGRSIKTASKSGAKVGAKYGAGINGAFSGVGNVAAVINGEKEIDKAIIEVAQDVAVGTADGAVKGAAASATTAACTHLASKVSSQVAKKVLGSSAPAAAAVGIVEVGKDAFDLAMGDIDPGEFAEKSAKTAAATTAGGWAGAEAGAALGAVGGPVGAVAGAVVGGILGSLGISSFFD